MGGRLRARKEDRARLLPRMLDRQNIIIAQHPRQHHTQSNLCLSKILWKKGCHILTVINETVIQTCLREIENQSAAHALRAKYDLYKGVLCRPRILKCLFYG